MSRFSLKQELHLASLLLQCSAGPRSVSNGCGIQVDRKSAGAQLCTIPDEQPPSDFSAVSRLPEVFLHRFTCMTFPCLIKPRPVLHRGALDTTQVSSRGGLDEGDVAHRHSGHCSARRKDGILPFVTTRMGLANIRLSEASQSE